MQGGTPQSTGGVGMRTQIRDFPGAIVETVTRYIGYEVSPTDDFSDDVGLDSIDLAAGHKVIWHGKRH